MSISAVCPDCRFAVVVPDEYSGRKGKCPQCGKVFVLNAPPKQASPQNTGSQKRVAPQPALPPTKPQSPPQPKPMAAASPAPKPAVDTTAGKKVPNPLLLRGQVALCPTLHTREQYEQYRKTILEPLREPLAMNAVSTGYKVALTILALILVLLFCTYLGMILGLCYFEYYYFTEIFGSLMKGLDTTGNAKGKVAVFVAYLAIPAGVAMVIAVLIKPLFFGWGAKDNRFEITREKEPLFFEFVDHLCNFVGASAPTRIFVDCQVNAAAGLSQGFLGALFGGNQCDLIIGLPLVAGMKTSEVAGVLAHEFGHFTQSGAKRISYIVRSILGWFAHIYYYRDKMDQWLIIGSQNGHYVNMIFCWIIRGLIWFARRIIWAFMLLGNLASGHLSRQMEFDADGFETKLVGSKSFAESSRKILMLSIANEKTIGDVRYMIQEDRLPDNYPLLIAANMEIHGDDWSSLVTKIINESKTGIYDTHPCDKERIAAAEQAAEPGVFHCKLPASLLFRNFLGLCREVSLDFYRSVIADWNPDMLKESSEIIDQLRREGESQRAIRRFFLRSYLAYRFLPLSFVAASKNVQEMAQRIRKARETQVQNAAKIREAVKAFDEADTNRSKAEFYRELVRVEIPLKKAAENFRFRSLAEAVQGVQKYELECARHHLQITQRDTLVAERLACARELLMQKEIQNRIEQGNDLHQRMETLFPILSKMGALQEEIETERKRFRLVNGLIQMIPHLADNHANAIFQNMGQDVESLKKMVWRFKRGFGDILYPFDHGVKDRKLGDFLVPYENETGMELRDIYQASNMLIDRFITTNTLILGEVCAIALTVETALSLPPLQMPSDE